MSNKKYTLLLINTETRRALYYIADVFKTFLLFWKCQGNQLKRTNDQKKKKKTRTVRGVPDGLRRRLNETILKHDNNYTVTE